MSERCPLSGGGMTVDSLPGICLRQCVELWERSLLSQAGEIDDYEQTPAVSTECDHTRFDVVFSHQALQAVDDTSNRLYSIVDMCEGCEVELQESVYTFQCPNN